MTENRDQAPTEDPAEEPLAPKAPGAGDYAPEPRPDVDPGPRHTCRMVALGFDPSGLPNLAIECPRHAAPVAVEVCLDCPAFAAIEGAGGHAAHLVCTPKLARHRGPR
ncbi:MAG: hypothetical protein HY904_21170 [Deltaproteobacteria bacterium]|nr:hypothetical protein [Deltaproteobacteria bacterium]